MFSRLALCLPVQPSLLSLPSPFCHSPLYCACHPLFFSLLQSRPPPFFPFFTILPFFHTLPSFFGQESIRWRKNNRFHYATHCLNTKSYNRPKKKGDNKNKQDPSTFKNENNNKQMRSTGYTTRGRLVQ